MQRTEGWRGKEMIMMTDLVSVNSPLRACQQHAICGTEDWARIYIHEKCTISTSECQDDTPFRSI